jgi:hypothetical protein
MWIAPSTLAFSVSFNSEVTSPFSSSFASATINPITKRQSTHFYIFLLFGNFRRRFIPRWRRKELSSQISNHPSTNKHANSQAKPNQIKKRDCSGQRTRKRDYPKVACLPGLLTTDGAMIVVCLGKERGTIQRTEKRNDTARYHGINRLTVWWEEVNGR